jgi:hypothetical protein
VTGGAEPPNAIPFAIGDEIPPSSFVSGTTENVP